MIHEFTVEDLSCKHCAVRVTNKLQRFDPDAAVRIDLAAHSVVIDGVAGRRDYAYAIRDAGYTAV